jgi:hypothetical protein
MSGIYIRGLIGKTSILAHLRLESRKRDAQMDYFLTLPQLSTPIFDQFTRRLVVGTKYLHKKVALSSYQGIHDCTARFFLYPGRTCILAEGGGWSLLFCIHLKGVFFVE